MERKIPVKNAAGLVEALIVMAIIGTTLISSMLLVARGFVEVRNNQTEDTINGILIQIMNKIKNSESMGIQVTEFNTITTGSDRYFYLSENDFLVLDTIEYSSAPMDSCTYESVYNVIANEVVETSLSQDLCIQISIRKMDLGLDNRFSGTIHYIYSLNGEVMKSSLDFAKFSSFSVQETSGIE